MCLLDPDVFLINYASLFIYKHSDLLCPTKGIFHISSENMVYGNSRRKKKSAEEKTWIKSFWKEQK